MEPDEVTLHIGKAILCNKAAIADHNLRGLPAALQRMAGKNLTAAQQAAQDRAYAQAATLLLLAQSSLRAANDPDPERDGHIARACLLLHKATT